MLLKEEADEPDFEILKHARALGEKFICPYTVDLQIDGTLIAMEVDTGTSMSLISDKSILSRL